MHHADQVNREARQHWIHRWGNGPRSGPDSLNLGDAAGFTSGIGSYVELS
jgi:hypothetical protein